MDYKKFMNKTEGQSLEDIVHKSKKNAQKLLEDQGISALAIFISEMMSDYIETYREKKKETVARKGILAPNQKTSILQR